MTRREFVAGVGAAVAGAGLPSEPAYAAIVQSSISCGVLRGIELAAARDVPEVLAAVRVASDDTIDFVGQPLGLIVARSREAALLAVQLFPLVPLPVKTKQSSFVMATKKDTLVKVF